MIQNPIIIERYLQEGENTDFDNLITAVSYEDRGFFSVEKILENFNVKRAIVILFGGEYLDKELQKTWEKQKEILIKIFKEQKVDYKEIYCDSVFFGDSIERIVDITQNESANIINITTLPKNYILRLAKEFDKKTNIFFYSRSEYREPTKRELNIGIKKIIPIEGFEGMRELTSEDLLILVLGYEGHRALSFLSIFSPYKVLPLVSIPKEGNKNIDSRFYNNVVSCNIDLLRKHTVLKNPDGGFYTVSSVNHLSFSKEIEEIINFYFENSPKKNHDDICISPLGTKSQTLGLYLYCKRNPATQVIYSVPTKRFDITYNALNQQKILDLPPEVEMEHLIYKI